jgi:CBS domain-containing protein
MKIAYPISAVIYRKSSTLWTVSPDSTVYDAIKLMSDKNIGALIVMGADGRLAGMFTERDYSRKIALQGKTSKETRVSEIMVSDVITITEEDTVEECMRLMTDKRVRHLPVVKEGKVAGIVSIGDLVNWIISTQDATIEQLERYIAGGVAA